MPPLVRHLMPLIVIGALLLFSVACALAIVFAIGRLFGRRVPPTPAGPVIEGSYSELPADDRPLRSGG
ncbi:MAG: hypothetical protein IT561_13895 [Alphaproteobacteria bacterium]|nr:hypothetical protein [Alphaproteobacteria bacterium]